MPTFNTTDPKPGYVYDSATDTWFPLVGIAPASQVDRWTKTAAGGETSLSGNDDNAVSLSYTSGTEQVYLNGVLLVRGQDYTATNGTTITGLTALAASDVAEVVTFNPSNILTTDSILDTDFAAKGDLISASAASTPIRVPVGTNGQVLKANSATTSGLEWGTDTTYSTPTIGSTAITSGATVTTISGLTLSAPLLSAPLLTSPEETANIIGSAPTATQTIDFVTSGVHYFTSNSTSNVTLNFRGNGSTTLNSLLPTGGSATFSVIFTNGSTAYIANAFQIDGSSVTPKWSGGTAPAAGNASSNDFYSFNILKTADATFTVFASGASKFA
jgi:trimeric autotransporter adhesin